MKRNLISILTPTYNRAAGFLPLTIKNVQRQSEKGFEHEHIIVDNCSTDDTAKVVKEFAKRDKRIKYVRNKTNAGPGPALNLAFKASKGELIVPLDDDDLMPLDSLQTRFDYHKEHKDVDWSYGYCFHIDENGKRLKTKWTSPPPRERSEFLACMLEDNIVSNGTVTMKRSAVNAVRGWDPKISAGQDWGMWCSLIYHSQKPGLIKSYLVLYRFHDRQRSLQSAKPGGWDKTKAYMIKKFKAKK